MPTLQQTYLKQQKCYEQLSELPDFSSLTPRRIILVNRFTDTILLHTIIDAAKKCTHFSVDTESDLHTQRPALIQVELIDTDVSLVILVEVCHLPSDKRSLIFWLIRAIFNFILRSGKMIYAWGNATAELSKFLRYGLFTAEQLAQPTPINVEAHFRDWYRLHFGDAPSHGNTWSLLSAIANLFHERLDKRETLNQWSRGLDRLPRDACFNKVQRMISYAANDCLAVTKIAYAIGETIVSRKI
jgi:hypothetical protein